MRNARHEILLVTDINLYAYFHSKKGQYIGYEKKQVLFLKKRPHFSPKVLVFFLQCYYAIFLTLKYHCQYLLSWR